MAIKSQKRFKIYLLITLILPLICSSECLAKSYIKEDNLFCTSKQALSNQYTFFVNGGKALVDGCYITNKKIEVIITKREVLSGFREVITLDGRTKFWTDRPAMVEE